VKYPRQKSNWHYDRILIAAFLLVVLLLALILGLPKLSQTLAGAKNSTTQSSSSNMATSSSALNGLVTSSSKTYFYHNNVQETGFQTVNGDTYYFDPTTKAEVGQMRPMTGEYWRESSMLKAYPDVAKLSKLSVFVSLSEQRVYLKSDTKVIYVMYASSGGEDGTTPTGNFTLNDYRAASFYNSAEGEGANYPTGFYEYSIYLFHSVPTDSSGQYILSQATLLGKSAASHGCIRLSVADSQWFQKNMPTGTPVSIH
jgi:Tfp pilus assembly protein PilV